MPPKRSGRRSNESQSGDSVGLVAAAAVWVLSGHLIPHETAESRAAIRPSEAANEKLFRVAVTETSVVPHSRKLVLSGRTEADRKVTLTARTGGVFDRAPGQARPAGETGRGDRDPVRRCARGASCAGACDVHTTDDRTGSAPQADRAGLVAEARNRQSRNAVQIGGSRPRGSGSRRDRRVIRAPWDGIITEVPSEVGGAAFSMAGKEIAQMVALDPMLAVVEVSERNSPASRSGTRRSRAS